MKKGGRIIRWISISVIFQVALLAYINFIYLPNRGNITASAFNFAEDSIKDKSVRLPEGASNISVSFNGLFAAYKMGNKLEIFDIEAKKVLKALEVKGGEISYLRWLPDRDILIYSVKEPEGKQGQVQLLTYDLAAGVERNYPRLKGLPDQSEVVDIELSPLTNIVYFMVKTSDTRTKIYSYNIMDKLKLIMNANVKTIIKETAYEDNLIYSDTSGRIYIRDGKNGNKNKIAFEDKMTLLAVDDEDNIYAGALSDDGMVKSIYIGKTDTPEKEWKLMNLVEPAEIGDIFIPAGGGIYVVDRKAGKIVEAGGSHTLSYKGEILDVLDDYVASIDGRKLNLLTAVK